MFLSLVICLPLLAPECNLNPDPALPFAQRVQRYCESNYFYGDYLEDAAVTFLLDAAVPPMASKFSYGAIAEIDWMLRRSEIIEDLTSEIMNHAVNGRIAVYRVRVERFSHQEDLYYRVQVIYEA